MALTFNEGAYGQAYQQGLANEQADRDRQLQSLQMLSQGIVGGIQASQEGKLKAQQAKRDQKLYDLQVADAQRKAKEFELENTPLEELLSGNRLSQPLNSSSVFDQFQGMGEAALPTQRASMIDKFRQFQQGRLAPPQVDMSSRALSQPDYASLGLPPEAGRMTLGQVKTAGQARKLFSEAQAEKQPGSIDAILAKRVNSGEITLEQAIEMKKSMAPEGSFMMGGITQSGQPVFYNTKDPSKVRTAEVPGGGMLYPKTPSEGQMNAGLFGKRAQEANQQLETMISEGFDPTSLETGGLRKLPNIMQPENVQKLEQAERNFMAAILRKESGALISPSEMIEGGKQYFPRAGDETGTLRQKDINRKTAIQGLGVMAGPMGAQMNSQAVVQAGGSNMPTVTDQASYNSLPSGSQYRDANGNIRRKK